VAGDLVKPWVEYDNMPSRLLEIAVAAADENPETARSHLVSLENIDMRSVEFVEKPFWQRSAFHLIAGVKNASKGTFLCHYAARVTRGEMGGKTNVIWVANGEDSYSIDIKPRLVAAGADVCRVFKLRAGRLVLPDDIDTFTESVRDVDAGLVIIDPLGGSLVGKNTNNDGEVGPALEALNILADEQDCMVAGVRHFSNKDTSRGGLASILGSSEWGNKPRVVIGIVHDEAEDMRLAYIVTSNRVPSGSTRQFRIEGVLLDGLTEEVPRAVDFAVSFKNPELVLAARNGGRGGRGQVARERILDILAKEGEQESDPLMNRVAQEVGLTVGHVIKLKVELGKKGLLQSHSQTDEYGTIQRWFVTPRPEAQT
jgi:hypothetical protein